MARNWTEAQRAAIYTQNADLLVSAAAGSGKTAVLVERIIQKITNSQKPVDIDRLLVVTFTNAAASEMRQRIGEALAHCIEEAPDNELLQRQLTLLPTASITTIHGFCHMLLRENFNILGLDPNFKIADTTENELLRLSALEEVIEELYEDSTYAEAFLELTEAYMQIKNPDSFYDLVNKIYNFVMSLPAPEKWLLEAEERFYLEEGFNNSLYAHEILACGKQIVQGILVKYDVMIPLAEIDDGQEDFWHFLIRERAEIAEFLQEESYDTFYRNLERFGFATIPRSPKNALPIYREQIRAMRDGIKKHEYKVLKEDLFALDSDNQAEVLYKLCPIMQALSEVVRRLMKRFDAKKNEKNILNFNDLEHGCLRLLVGDDGRKTELAESLTARFDEILIDEYQDTSALQEAIFQAIKKEKSLFMVGDIKQSIYRFRNTNPLLFREKKETFSKEMGSVQQKIILSQNFRSRPAVLEGINYIFTRIMSPEVGEIRYDEEEMLHPGAQYPETEHTLSAEIELYLADLQEQDNEDEEELEGAEAEALMAAKRIAELIESRVQVFSSGVMREIQYRDICILLRSTKSQAECYTKVLSACGIPCYSETGGSFLESEEVDVMLSLLKIIDNPHQDIPLLAVLRSQLYAFSADELGEIRLADKKADFYTALVKRAETEDELGHKLRRFLETLAVFRKKSRQLSMAELVWYLYMQTGFYEAQAMLPGSVLRRLNLRLLYVRASAFEQTGLRGLYSFVHFIDEYASIGGDYDAARAIGEEQNVVRIMSIHKSKGLEFPVVLLGGLARGFNLRDLYEKVLIHSDLGYGPQYIDTDLGIVHESVARTLIKQTLKRESLSEEERILYVALTRAREKLILLTASSKLSACINRAAIVPFKGTIPGVLALEAGSYLDWILMALLSHPDGTVLRDMSEVEVAVNPNATGHFAVHLLSSSDLEFQMPEEQEEEMYFENDAELQYLLSRLEAQYPFESETALPAKITVTELKRKFADEAPESMYLCPRPDFLKKQTSKLTAAEAGTALHTFLEHLDFARSSDIREINEQIDTLVMRGILSGLEAESISLNTVLRFVQSDIGKRLRTAPKVCREVSFGFNFDAEPVFGTSGEVMLQGIIDCVLFEEDGISVIDYKTDRVRDISAIMERYRVQLFCYRKAAEKIYQKPVLHTYLYLFDTGEILEL